MIFIHIYTKLVCHFKVIFLNFVLDGPEQLCLVILYSVSKFRPTKFELSYKYIWIGHIDMEIDIGQIEIEFMWICLAFIWESYLVVFVNSIIIFSFTRDGGPTWNND